MDNQEAIDILQEKISPCVAGKWKEAVDAAISALQEQDSKTRKICDTCKHDPPSKKWPCADCDMRDPADRWEPKDVPDTNAGDMVSRRAAIDALMDEFKRVPTTAIRAKNRIDRLPSAQPNLQPTCKQLATNLQQSCNNLATNTISKRAAIDALDSIGSLDTDADREYAREVFETLPSAPDRCDTCRFVYYPKETNNNDQ